MTVSGYGRTLQGMARPRDEDMLEPILPKHPPYQREEVGGEGEPVEASTPSAAPVRPSWDRIVLVGCAVVATLSLVIVAMRTSSIAEDQRVQTCQVRVYAAERSTGSFGGRDAEHRLARDLAECVGIEPAGDGEDERD